LGIRRNSLKLCILFFGFGFFSITFLFFSFRALDKAGYYGSQLLSARKHTVGPIVHIVINSLDNDVV